MPSGQRCKRSTNGAEIVQCGLSSATSARQQSVCFICGDAAIRYVAKTVCAPTDRHTKKGDDCVCLVLTTHTPPSRPSSEGKHLLAVGSMDSFLGWHLTSAYCVAYLGVTHVADQSSLCTTMTGSVSPLAKRESSVVPGVLLRLVIAPMRALVKVCAPPGKVAVGVF